MAENREHDSHTLARTDRLAGGSRTHLVYFPYWYERWDLNPQNLVSKTSMYAYSITLAFKLAPLMGFDPITLPLTGVRSPN